MLCNCLSRVQLVQWALQVLVAQMVLLVLKVNNWSMVIKFQISFDWISRSRGYERRKRWSRITWSSRSKRWQSEYSFEFHNRMLIDLLFENKRGDPVNLVCLVCRNSNLISFQFYNTYFFFFFLRSSWFTWLTRSKSKSIWFNYWIY